MVDAVVVFDRLAEEVNVVEEVGEFDLLEERVEVRDAIFVRVFAADDVVVLLEVVDADPIGELVPVFEEYAVIDASLLKNGVAVEYRERVTSPLCFALNVLAGVRVDVLVDVEERVGITISFNKSLLRSLFSHFFKDLAAINPKLISINIRRMAF